MLANRQIRLDTFGEEVVITARSECPQGGQPRV